MGRKRAAVTVDEELVSLCPPRGWGLDLDSLGQVVAATPLAPDAAAKLVPCLLFLSGAEVGRVVPIAFDGGRVTIGRDADDDITLDSPEVSRRHATLSLERGKLVLVDEGSLNGTFVNEDPIQRQVLAHGDCIRFGPLARVKLTLRDVQEIELSNRLYDLAHSDCLTGVANKRAFLRNLEAECAVAQRHKTALSLAILDLDHFKAINDRLGHMAGDEILREVGARLRGTIRIEDLLARFGGEEFVVLSRDTEPEGALALAVRIQRAIGETPFVVEGEEVTVTVSIGVTSQRRGQASYLSPAELLRVADARLYRAKHAGRNCICGEG
jgi:two-component system cell cycle response regulator